MEIATGEAHDRSSQEVRDEEGNRLIFIEPQLSALLGEVRAIRALALDRVVFSPRPQGS